jgi:hypothetical protein
MPRIPTFENQVRPTAEVGAAIGGVQAPLTTGLSALTNTLNEYYIQEKKKEAAVKTLDYKNQYWNDSEDGTQGLFSIKNKHENNPNTTEAINGLKEDGKSYEQYLNNKLSGESSYLKQSVISEFKADLNRITLTVQEKSQDALDKKQGLLADNIISTEMAVLQDNPALLPTSKVKLEKALEDLFPNNQIKKQQYLEKGFETFDKFVSTKENDNNPIQSASNLKDPNTYPNLNAETRMQLIKTAQTNAFTIKSQQLLTTIPLDGIRNEQDLFILKKQAQTGNFSGDKNLQTIYNSFTDLEKAKFQNTLDTRVKDIRTDLSLARTSETTRITNNAIKQTDERVKSVLDQNTSNRQIETDPNLKSSPDVKDQLKSINDKFASNTFVDKSNFNLNLKITEMLFSGDIKSPTQKFKIGSELEAKSILERAGDGLSKQDVNKYQELFNKGGDSTYINSYKDFYKFVNSYKNSVQGGTTFSSIDPAANDRANRFKEDMLIRFEQGLKDGKTSNQLLNPSNLFGTNNNFIGKDIGNYIPSSSDITKSINDAVIKSRSSTNQNPPPARLPKETPGEYLKSDKYLNWLKSQGK